jgi:hypothetical protein
MSEFPTAKSISDEASKLLDKCEALGEYDVNAGDKIKILKMLFAIAEILRKREMKIERTQ